VHLRRRLQKQASAAQFEQPGVTAAHAAATAAA